MASRLAAGAIALFQILAVGLVEPGAAHAVIIQEGRDPDQDKALEIAAHAAGAKYKCVVNIYFNEAEGRRLSHGSGVYIGPGADGKTGYILTAGHLLSLDPERPDGVPTKPAGAFPGAVLRREHRIVIDKIYIHPGYDYQPEVPGRTVKNDLALLAFNLARNGKAVRAAGLAPATLAKSLDGLDRISLEAETVGFGQIGTNRGGQPVHSDRVHAGKTLVTYGPRQGHNQFIHWSPILAEVRAAERAGQDVLSQLFYAFDLSPEKIQASELQDWDPRAAESYAERFEPGHRGRDGAETVQAPGPEDPRASQWIQSHPAQVVLAEGDSGGPLFVTTPAGPELVGVASTVCPGVLVPARGTQPVLCLSNVWEPVFDHLAWIRAVQQGPSASAWVLEGDMKRWKKKGSLPAKL